MRSDDKRSRERIQWADLDKHREDFHLIGRGEGRAIVHFGMGFSYPPTLDFSSVMHHEETDVIPSVIVSPRGSLDNDIDPDGLGNDGQALGELICDSGFEAQSVWATLYPNAATIIPTTNEIMQLEWDSNWGGPGDGRWPIEAARFADPPQNSWADRQMSGNPQGPHQWVQTDENKDRWSTTNTQSHDLGIGEAGKYSATSLVGPNGYTNWLIPVQPGTTFEGLHHSIIAIPFMSRNVHDPFPTGPNSTTNSAHLSEHFFASVYEHSAFQPYDVAGDKDGDFQMTTEPPPFLGGFDGFAYVKSDQSCAFESQGIIWHHDGDLVTHVGQPTQSTSGPQEEILFNDSQIALDHWGRNGQNPEYASHRQMGTTDHSLDVDGEEWSRVDISLPYEGKRLFPAAPPADPWTLSEPQYPFWTLKFRVKGVPGTNVYVDNIFLWRQLRNAGAPVMTIGVAEWLMDESGVYIGADVWFKVGTPRVNS